MACLWVRRVKQPVGSECRVSSAVKVDLSQPGEVTMATYDEEHGPKEVMFRLLD